MSRHRDIRRMDYTEGNAYMLGQTNSNVLVHRFF